MICITQEINKIFGRLPHTNTIPKFRLNEIGEIHFGDLLSWSVELASNNLPSTCPPVFFTSSSAILTPVNTFLNRELRKIQLHWWKSAKRRREKLDERSKPCPERTQKQNRRVHVSQAQAHAIWRKIGASRRECDSNPSFSPSSWNV